MRIVATLVATLLGFAAAPVPASSTVSSEAADTTAIERRIDAALQATATDMLARIEARNALAIDGAPAAQPPRIAARPVRVAPVARTLRW